jgi:hypothetical protein
LQNLAPLNGIIKENFLDYVLATPDRSTLPPTKLKSENWFISYKNIKNERDRHLPYTLA